MLLMEFSLAIGKAGVDELAVVPRSLAVSTSDSQNAVRFYPERLCARNFYRVQPCRMHTHCPTDIHLCSVPSDHEGASTPESGETLSFGIAGEQCLLQEIVGYALVPSANQLVAWAGAHMIIISPRCRTRSATTPWMSSRSPVREGALRLMPVGGIKTSRCW